MWKRLALALGMAFAALGGTAAEAKPGFGENIDAYCSTLGRGTPFADLAGAGFLSECSLCHAFTYPPELPSKGNVFDPPGAEYLLARRSGNYSWFCPAVAANQLPVIAALPDRSVNVGQMVVIDVSASDPDGDPLVLTVANAPLGAAFTDHGDGTATFSWTPGAGDLGSRSLSFLAQDDAVPPGQAMEALTLTVGSTNRPPVLGAIGNRSLAAGAPLSIAVSASDPDGDALVLGAAPLPSGASFADAGDGTGLFTWTPSLGQAGNHTLTFAAQDDGVPSASDQEQVTITVGGANRPPVLAPIGSRSVTIGRRLDVALRATDADGDALAFAATGLPAGAQLDDAGNGSATLRWTPAAGDEGVYALRVEVSDDGSPPESDAESLELTVLPASPAADVRIDDARWLAERGGEGRLVVRGSGANPRESVGILDPATGLVLGSRKAGRHGGFRFELEPMTPPCEVAAQAGESRSEPVPVAGAPADCGEAVQLEVNARWKCAEEDDEGEMHEAGLRVRGERAPAGALVEVRDAASDALLATAQVGMRGRFEAKAALATPPRAVDVVVSAGELEWLAADVAVHVEDCDDDEDEDEDDERDDEARR